MTASQATLLDQLVKACEAVGVSWRLGVDMPGVPLQFYVPADRFAAVRSRIRCRIDVVCSGGIWRAFLYDPDDSGEAAIGVALLEDSAFEALDRSFHFTNKQLDAFCQIHNVLQEANIRWLVADVAQWPLEVAVPTSRFSTLAVPDVAGVFFVPMHDAALNSALLDHALAHFRMVGAACDGRGVDWVVTSTQAMLAHGLPEWPESNSLRAAVSDVCFHEELPLPPGVHKAIWRVGVPGKSCLRTPLFRCSIFGSGP